MNKNISEDDLQAYADGCLDAARSALVERHMEQDPGTAARVAAYIQQSHDLRSAFASIAVKPVLPDAAGHAVYRETRRPFRMAAAAAVIMAFAIGGGSGWVTRGQMAPPQLTGISALTQEAVANHLVYTEDLRRPVELTADRQEVLVHWLSKRLNTQLKVPDLTQAGYRLLGGRLAATDHGPAAMLIYQDAAGDRLTVFTRPMTQDHSRTRTIAVNADGVHGFAWICDGLGYSVLATEDHGDLRRLANIVRRQVDPS